MASTEKPPLGKASGAPQGVTFTSLYLLVDEALAKLAN